MSEPQLKILVVEDNMGDYFLVHEYLHSNFSNPTITHNELLEDANRSLSSEQFDVILLDLTLPDSNGKESVESVVKMANDAPVIVLTGYSDRQFAMDSLKIGVQDYLIKDEVNAFVLQKSITYSIERNKIGKTLLQNEKRFRALIENSTDGLVVCSTDRQIQDLSSAGQKIIGYSKEDLVEVLREDLIHPEDLANAREAFEKVQVQPNAIVSLEYRFMLPDKQYIWLDSSFHNLLFEPSVKGIVEHFKNISDRKAAEESIKVSEEKYRYLYNNNPDLIIIWDLESNKILDVNDTAMAFLGFSNEEFLDKNITDLLHENDLDALEHMKVNLKSNHSQVEKEVLRKIAKDGSQIFLDLAFHKINYNGINAILSIGSDVSEKIKLEQILEEEKTKKQMEITEAVITAQERERQEIGLELHDNVNQILAGSLMYLGLLKKELKINSDLFNDIDKLITGAINEIRRLSHSLIPPSLNEVPLGDALDQFITVM